MCGNNAAISMGTKEKPIFCHKMSAAYKCQPPPKDKKGKKAIKTGRSIRGMHQRWCKRTESEGLGKQQPGICLAKEWGTQRERRGENAELSARRVISAQPHPHTHTPTHRERETREYPQRGPLDHFKDLLGGVGKCLLRHSFPAGHTLDVEERDVGMPRKPSTFLSQGTCVSSLVSR